MKKTQFIIPIVCLWGLVTAACTSREEKTGNWQVIPLPQEIELSEGKSPFAIRPSTVICYPSDNSQVERTARFLAASIRKLTGIAVGLSAQVPEEGDCISLRVDGSIAHAEGYELAVSSKRIDLRGGSEAGVFYGVQTLCKAILPGTGEQESLLPAGTLADYPRFGYRGFMVDVARHFLPVDSLKKIVDILAMHNLNVLHLHLTDDQGWRIEIKKYPYLTPIGTLRDSTSANPVGSVSDTVLHRQYYTQEEARELVQYAADRHVTIVPEIDLPGHMLAALAAYPELGCTGGPYEVPDSAGVYPDVLCVGNEQSLQFARDVLTEIMNIFPSEYVHIGGNSCPKTRWEKCPKCQAMIREMGLEDTPEYTRENQLQAYFMNLLEQEVEARGRKTMVWDDVLAGEPARTAMIAAHTSPQATAQAARWGHPTVACPSAYLCFSDSCSNRLTRVSSVARVYNFEPVPAELTPAAQANIVGVEGCLWAEHAAGSQQLEEQMLPRLAALAELQWAMPGQKDLGRFLHRLSRQLALYELCGYRYRPDIKEALTNTPPSAADSTQAAGRD